MRGYLKKGQVGNPCVHVVCPFTIYRLGLSVANKVSIQINNINNLITLYYFDILYCIFS